jgi:hypothetical protein
LKLEVIELEVPAGGALRVEACGPREGSGIGGEWGGEGAAKEEEQGGGNDGRHFDCWGSDLLRKYGSVVVKTVENECRKEIRMKAVDVEMKGLLCVMLN